MDPILDAILDAPQGMYVIFFSYGCPYCENALKLLNLKNVHYRGYDIDTLDGGVNHLLNVLINNADQLNYNINHHTKPIIFKNGKFLGGYDELRRVM